MPYDFTLGLSIALFVFAIAAAFVYAYRRGARIADPVTIFLVFYPLFVLPLPIRAWLTLQADADVTPHIAALLPYLPRAVLLCAAGLPLLLWGYESKWAARIASRIPRPRPGSNSGRAFWILSGVSMLLLVMLARETGSLLDFLLLGYGSTSEMFGKGYLAVGFPWLQVASLFLLYRYSVTRKLRDLIFFALAAVFHIAMQLAIGQRNPIVYFALAAWLFWHHAIGPLRLTRLVPALLAGFMALNFVGAIRGSNFEGLADFWSRTQDSSDAAADDPQSFFYTIIEGEFVVPFEALPQMMASVGSGIDPRLGRTYLEAPLFFIPGVFFPGRPPALAHWYMETYYGASVGLNEGRAFFFLAEGYLNFGALGVLGTMYAWGIFLGVCRGFIRHANGEPGAVLLYALTVAFIFRGIAGDLASMLVALPEQALSAAVIGLWFAADRQPARVAHAAAGLSGTVLS